MPTIAARQIPPVESETGVPTSQSVPSLSESSRRRRLAKRALAGLADEWAETDRRAYYGYFMRCNGSSMWIGCTLTVGALTVKGESALTGTEMAAKPVACVPLVIARPGHQRLCRMRPIAATRLTLVHADGAGVPARYEHPLNLIVCYAVRLWRNGGEGSAAYASGLLSEPVAPSSS